jgi:hypothetical protein
MNWQVSLQSPRNWIIGFAILLIGILLVFLFFNKLVPQNAYETSQNVPELKDILDSADLKKQLNATRKLADRVGVEEAQEILYRSSLPRTGEGHLVVHQIGYSAYKNYGVDAVTKCKDYFLYACYHGAIIEAASDKGFEIIPKMTDNCKKYAGRYFQCVHGAGHALVAMWGYDLPKALEMCDEFYENETDTPSVLISCHNGAFMENIFGVHDWETGKAPVRDWLSDDDPYFPCNQFGEKYQEGCWANQASRIFHLNRGDLAQTTKDCDSIGNEQYTYWCVDSLARQINSLTYGNPLATFEICKQMGTHWYDTCVLINAGAYYSLTGRDEAIAICAEASSGLKIDCYNGLISSISSDPIEQSEKELLCQKIEPQFINQCLEAIKTTSP